MFAVIDCGTTFTRIFFISEGAIVASGARKVGVRDSTLTGTNDTLREGITALYFDVLKENSIQESDVEFIVASGMITSEDGLKEIPHLIAPVGLQELAQGVVSVEAGELIPTTCPFYFVPGVKNRYPECSDASVLPEIDFMRGEEVQCMGILREKVETPCCIVALSSHTKIIYIDRDQKIHSSITTISGQLFEAIVSSTNIGKSIVPVEGETAGGYDPEQLVDLAQSCVAECGLSRALMMPRFLQILLESNSDERALFANAAIAADDIKIFENMRKRGYEVKKYILYGQQNRCELYSGMLTQLYGDSIEIECVSDPEELAMLTVRGSSAVLEEYFKNRAAAQPALV